MYKELLEKTGQSRRLAFRLITQMMTTMTVTKIIDDDNDDSADDADDALMVMLIMSYIWIY